ncbi:hypothetical protein OPIT5_18460 [Opitutaceae bacterium TAV5]|nr:hypothetical protein OPIT5_18460 [Opitutaceae bacterium TAV5]
MVWVLARGAVILWMTDGADEVVFGLEGQGRCR